MTEVPTPIGSHSTLARVTDLVSRGTELAITPDALRQGFTYEELELVEYLNAGFEQREMFQQLHRAWRERVEAEANALKDQFELSVAQIVIILWTARMLLVSGHFDGAFEEYDSALEYAANMAGADANKMQSVLDRVKAEIVRAQEFADANY